MLKIALPADVEDRLKGEASRNGLPAEKYAEKLIIDHLPPAGPNGSLADLLVAWSAEDHTGDPAEITRREQETEKFKAALARNRTEMEGPGSRKLFQ